MKISHFIAASAIALFAATSANAADAIMAQEPTPEYTPPAFTWSGGYIGAQVGYGWGKSEGEFTDFSTELKPDGFLGGIYGGYNFETGSNVVLGIDADINYANLKEEADFFDGPDYVFTGETKLRWEGAVRARAGYAVDRFLPYIAGGFAFGEVEHSANFDGLGLFEEKKTRTGWTAGAGVDYAATDNLILRLEYRYTDLGDEDYTFAGNDFNVDFKSHEVRLGVAYKF
ncbi:porin family protein [Phyllobacterium salinisoli]|uniref:Porin family protein n=1 Tax=Phyllobacterium salinisoli TaxID=1899321 RepID=A0A368K6Q3_9HYPH|nr:outer membrane protein [Phyllobacterium salinisoli]RCS24911.1 porin family protein [Phyllobacterium salinisoli]